MPPGSPARPPPVPAHSPPRDIPQQPSSLLEELGADSVKGDVLIAPTQAQRHDPQRTSTRADTLTLTLVPTLTLILILTLTLILVPLVAQDEEGAPPGTVGSEPPHTPRAVMEPDWTQPVSR